MDKYYTATHYKDDKLTDAQLTSTEILTVVTMFRFGLIFDNVFKLIDIPRVL